MSVYTRSPQNIGGVVRKILNEENHPKSEQTSPPHSPSESVPSHAGGPKEKMISLGSKCTTIRG